jgi:hypothetical protein
MVALPPKVGGLTAPPTGSKIADKFLADKVAELEKAAAAKATPAPIAPAAPAPIAPAPVLEAAPQLPVKEKRKPKLPGNEPPYAVQHQIIQVGEHVWEFTHKGKLTFPDGTQQLTAAAGTSPTNWKQTVGPQTIIKRDTSGDIITVQITTIGNPVQVIVTGDANNMQAGASWCRLQLFRDNTAIGGIVQCESSSANENVPYCLNFIDTPPAGTYTYKLRSLTTAGSDYQFGESSGPVITAVEFK